MPRPLLPVLALLASLASAPAGAQTVPPRDDAAQDMSFAAYRGELLAAARARDVEAVLARTAADVQLSFGLDRGRDTLRTWLTEGSGFLPAERLWRELEEILVLGAVRRPDNGFCTPYIACDDFGLAYDPFAVAFVVRDRAPAYAAPADDAAVVATLSHAVLDVTESIDPVWSRVRLPDGRDAFLRWPDIRRPVGYRAYFRNTGHGWRMEAFLAGD
jgi:hypothetical protein